MADAEWIQHLEHGIRELKKKIHNLKQEKAELKANYNKALSDVVTLTEENKELKAQIVEYDDLTEELDYRKREAKRLGWKSNLMEEDTIKELKDIGEF